MKKIAKSIFLSTAIFAGVIANAKYQSNEFSIEALSSKNISNSQPLVMCLPASEGFAPNVNVQVQQYPGTLDDYLKLSMNQFKKLKFKVIKNKATKNQLILEYTGNIQNRQLHWYAVVYKKGNNVFLTTATSTEKQWKTLSKKLINCVNSFRLK
jgi:hypothetical protein